MQSRLGVNSGRRGRLHRPRGDSEIWHGPFYVVPSCTSGAGGTSCFPTGPRSPIHHRELRLRRPVRTRDRHLEPARSSSKKRGGSTPHSSTASARQPGRLPRDAPAPGGRHHGNGRRPGGMRLRSSSCAARRAFPRGAAARVPHRIRRRPRMVRARPEVPIEVDAEQPALGPARGARAGSWRNGHRVPRGGAAGEPSCQSGKILAAFPSRTGTQSKTLSPTWATPSSSFPLATRKQNSHRVGPISCRSSYCWRG